MDAKTAEFPMNGNAHIWIKTVGKKETKTVEYEMDCKSNRLNVTSVVTYDSGGKIMNSSDENSGWQRIVPDSIGEQFFDGACSVRQ